MRICNHCNILLNDGSPFCVRCGNATQPYTGGSSVATDSSPSVGTKVMGFIGFGLGISGVLVATIAFFSAIASFDRYYSGPAIEAMILAVISLGQNIAGKILTAKAIEQNFISGITKAGKILNLIGFILNIVAAGLAFLAAIVCSL